MTLTRTERIDAVVRPVDPRLGRVETAAAPARLDRIGTAPYAVFAVRVHRMERLSPSFLRITFTGEDLDLFADRGNDQRIKIVLPVPGQGLPDFPVGSDWYSIWRRLSVEHRSPIRTYTVRRARPEVREIDVDVVLHGDGGPASRWAAAARPGDEVLVVGPNVRCEGAVGGAEWRPPAAASCLLLGGDETAVPAISAILEGLPADARGVAVLEVPEPGDVLPLTAPVGVRLDWRVRIHPGAGLPGVVHAGHGHPHGQLLDAGVRSAAAALLRGAVPAPRPALRPADAAALSESDDDGDVLWDVPQDVPEGTELYAWLAGESTSIAGLRRHLVRELCVDRRSVVLMG